MADRQKQGNQSAESPHSESIRYQVQGWLMEEGWHVRDDPPDPTVQWKLTAVDDSQRHILVAQPIGSSDRIIIQAALAFRKETRDALESGGSESLDEILWDIRFRLLQMGVGFSGFDELKRLVFVQRIYNDALTKDEFLQRVSQVKNALLVCLWTLQRYGQKIQSQEGKSLGFRKEG